MENKYFISNIQEKAVKQTEKALELLHAKYIISDTAYDPAGNQLPNYRTLYFLPDQDPLLVQVFFNTYMRLQHGFVEGLRKIGYEITEDQSHHIFYGMSKAEVEDFLGQHKDSQLDR